MKIRLRLALLFVLLLALSFLFVGSLLLGAVKDSGLSDAQQSTEAELERLWDDYHGRLLGVDDPALPETAQRSLALYLLRQCRAADLKLILLRGGETLFNSLGLAAEPLLESPAPRTVRTDGRTYYIAVSEPEPSPLGSCRLLLARDVTEVYARVSTLARRFASICAGAFCASAAVILLAVFRALRPLKALQQRAAEIADGIYDGRIELRGRDEIAELASSFNKMAAAVQRQLDAVTATAQERKLLLAALTHEMKTPMTGIIGYSEALQKLKLSEAQREEAVSYIHRECRRLERLTQKLMRLITLTDGESLTPQLQPTAVLLDTVTPTLSRAADERGVALTVRDGGAALCMDCDLLASALIDLFDNACEAGASHIAIEADGDALTVTDDGCGIEQALLCRVTQPFFRADRARRSGRENAGLGLALVARIAELHGAALHIDSETGRGTKVTLRFSP